jgi:hypothetical protein
MGLAIAIVVSVVIGIVIAMTFSLGWGIGIAAVCGVCTEYVSEPVTSHAMVK